MSYHTNMFDILLSFNFIWIALLIIILSSAVSYFCITLHQRLMYITAAEWLTEHVYCPSVRVLLLLFMAFLLFPLMFLNTGYGELLQLFLQNHFLINMMNILFFSGLIFSFVPLLNHPAFAMPILSCLATGLLYLHHLAIPAQIDFNWIPTGSAFGKIILLMLATYMISRWLNNRVSEWVDLRFMVTESKNLISDINYLIFQMPVVLAYGQSLAVQNTVS